MKNKRILYLHNNPLDFGKANMRQVVKVCDSLTKVGFNVTLGLPRANKSIIKQRLHHLKSQYDVSFTIIWFDNSWVIRALGRMKIPQYDLLFKVKNYDLVFTRDPSIVKRIKYFKIPLLYEAHNYLFDQRGGKFDRNYLKVMRDIFGASKHRIITISENLKKYLISVGFNEEFIHVEHDCHDGIDFDGGKVGAELKIALEEHRTNYDFLAVYTGSLAKDRGLEILSEVTLSFKNVAFFIAGGNNSEKAYWSELLPNDNIMVYNRLTTDEVKYVQSQSDFLLGIWGGSIPTMEYCSPLKLFEYMAWGKPVILSDFQVFHEVVDEESVYFFEKESVESFIESFSKVINERMDFEDKRNALLKSASYFTWDKRADRIKAIIEKL